ncbi:MAG: thioredoxin domain-containing protein [Waddliaceae bacterium]
MATQKKYTNRLVHEKSPYLLQHAHNPVDWYPWGEEAFQEAKESDKPIFLSVGYATCHWCHTMESESFEDVELSELMNETFVNIMVDREEHPEVDSIYMEFAQSMMGGVAGWPLNLILTPELKPFFAATYLPPRTKGGLMGLSDLILRISEVWHSDEKEKVLDQAEKITLAFQESIDVEEEEFPKEELIEEAIELLFKMTDSTYGGLKGTPKFPIPYQTNLLMHYSSLYNDSRALFIVERTLDMMQRGGIYDHLGGGFSRYSIDEKWQIPHFEKMLYDNALLSHAYLEAWKLTKKDLYRGISLNIFDYILREMTHPKGGFYSAQDADTEGKEGIFYTWTLEEVQSHLGGRDSQLFCEYFGVTEEGNFEGRNVLHTTKRFHEFAKERDLDPVEFEKYIVEFQQYLRKMRELRDLPLKDDKILSSWNGLTIYSIVEAGCAMHNPQLIQAGVQAARFIKDNLWREGRLLRRWREGEANYSGGLEDYAFLIRGVLSLFEAGLGTEWMQWAMEMTDILADQFEAENGGFYQTDGGDPYLILRKCQFSDSGEPSGNAVHCENLLRLYQFSYDRNYLEQAENILCAAEAVFRSYLSGFGYHILDLIRYYHRSKAPTLIVALNQHQNYREDIQEKIFSTFIPHRAVIWRREGDEQLFSLFPFVREYIPLQGETTLYICHERACDKPLTKIEDIKEAIEKL